jgi:hypothetical protein
MPTNFVCFVCLFVNSNINKLVIVVMHSFICGIFIYYLDELGAPGVDFKALSSSKEKLNLKQLL